MAGSSSTSQRRSRAIANLNEEQAQHKRDTDRKAQRAFRQRTKDCISSLEQENARIRESFRSREAELEQQIRVLREHNQSLSQSLESILDLASATLGVSCDGSVTTAESHLDIHPHEESQLRLITSLARDDELSATMGFDQRHGRDKTIIPCTGNDVSSVSPRQNSIDGSTYVMSHPESATVGHAVATSCSLTKGLISPYSSAADQNSQHYCSQDAPGGVSAYQASTTSPFAAEQTEPINEVIHSPNPVLLLERVNDDLPQNDGVTTVPIPSSMATVSRTSVTGASTSYSGHAVFTVVPPFAPSVCPLDDILHNFLASRRVMVADGATLETVIGPTRPSVKKLRNPENTEALHSLENLMSDVLSTYLQVKMPQKMAFFWVMNQTMRWMISRTKESYMYMPSWLRPTATQITVPHAIWITNIPWPGVRDLLVENPEDYPYETVGKWYTGHVSVNWNFDTLDAIDEVGGAERVHSIFEKHLRNLKNWTVSPAFLERFPAMASLIHG